MILADERKKEKDGKRTRKKNEKGRKKKERKKKHSPKGFDDMESRTE